MGLRHPRNRVGTAGYESPRRLHRASCTCIALLATVAALLACASTALAEKVIEKPVNISTYPPTISGKAQEGITLKAKEGKWSGGGIVYSFQWQRCEPELECTNIPLATTAEYTARYVDIGSTLRVLITAANSAGTTEMFTERTAAVVGVAPKNIELPVITGAAQEGQLLSVSSGAWSGTVTSGYLYAWERCAGKRCSEIAGANASSYRVAAADVGDTLRVAVTDQNLAGSKSATSLPTAIVTYGPPVPIGFPSITRPPARRRHARSEHRPLGRGRPDRIRLCVGSVQRRRSLHARVRLHLRAGGRHRRRHREALGQRAQQTRHRERQLGGFSDRHRRRRTLRRRLG